MPNFTICQSISNGFFIIFYVLFLSFVTAIPQGGVWGEKRRFCEAKIGAFGVFAGRFRFFAMRKRTDFGQIKSLAAVAARLQN
jgi:hypothetical protein